MQEKTQSVKQQKLLNKSENLQGRRRIPKHMLELKSTGYIQTLEISVFRVCVSHTELDWHWNSRHSKSQYNLLAISITAWFANDMHFSV